MSETPRRNSEVPRIVAVEQYLRDASDDDLLSFLRSVPLVWSDREQITLNDFIYEALLWPYVKHAWSVVKGQPGLPGRMRQLSDVYALAERRMELDTGRKRRIPRMTNLVAFIDAYERGLLHPNGSGHQ